MTTDMVIFQTPFFGVYTEFLKLYVVSMIVQFKSFYRRDISATLSAGNVSNMFIYDLPLYSH